MADNPYEDLLPNQNKSNPYSDLLPGSTIPSHENFIQNAIRNTLSNTPGIVGELTKRYPKEHIPSVEEIQDVVEESLVLMDFPKTTKAYILYRQERSIVREKQRIIPEHVKHLVDLS